MPLRRTRRTLILLILLNVSLIIPLAMYASATVHMRLTADEYCIAVATRDQGQGQGLIGGATFMYNSYVGRFLSMFILGLALSAGIPAEPFITVSLIVFWWLVVFALFRVIFRGQVYRGGQAALAASLFTVALFAGLPRVERTVYWLNGIAYVFLATALFLTYLWLVIQSGVRNTALTIAGYGLLGFIICDISDTMGIPALLLLAMGYGLSFIRSEIPGRLRPRLLAAMIGVCVALVTIGLAPGSHVRQELMGSNPGLGFAVYGTLSGLAAAGTIAFVQNPFACLSLLILPFCAGYYGPSRAKQQASLYLLLAFGVAGILLAACFAPPFLAIGAPLNDHGYTAPLTITFCLFIVVGYFLGVRLKPGRLAPVLPVRVALIAALLLGGMSLTASKQAADTANGLRSYAQAWDARDQEIRRLIGAGETRPFVGPLTNPYDANIRIDPGGKASPYVAPISSPFRWELHDDPNYWVNKCVAWYYGIQSIVSTTTW